MERMGSLMWSRIFGNLVPVLCGVFAVFLTNLPFSILGGWLPSPLYALMPVYFWCLVRPDLMSPVWAFLIGVLHDVLSGGPPGMWAASFVATYAVIDRQRDAFAGLAGFAALLGFATAALVANLTSYLILMLYHWQLLSPSPFAKEFAVTALLYWPVLFGLNWIHRHVVGPSRSELI
jgi:rod shape-determining protein MreD